MLLDVCDQPATKVRERETQRSERSSLVLRRVFTFFVPELTEIIEKHVFVGIVDLPRCLSLIQHSTKLYLINHGALAYVRSFVQCDRSLYWSARNFSTN